MFRLSSILRLYVTRRYFISILRNNNAFCFRFLRRNSRRPRGFGCAYGKPYSKHIRGRLAEALLLWKRIMVEDGATINIYLSRGDRLTFRTWLLQCHSHLIKFRERTCHCYGWTQTKDNWRWTAGEEKQNGKWDNSIQNATIKKSNFKLYIFQKIIVFVWIQLRYYSIPLHWTTLRSRQP